MKKEHSELLLRDLCGRLPYGVKAAVNQSELQNYDYNWKNWNFDEEPQEIDGVSIYGVTFDCMDMGDDVIGFEYIKPYLFPLSSMTEEQYNEFFSYFHSVEMEEVRTSGDYLKAAYLGENAKREWLDKNHFDYHYLIPMDLAIDATGKNIY